VGFDALVEDDYDRLAASIKMLYTRKEWLCLSDFEKATLEQRECEPEEWNE